MFPPNPDDLKTESDVEQKFAWPLLTGSKPHGLGFPDAEIFTKPNIREFQIGKGNSAKRYYPDYVTTVLGLPLLIIEAKKPGEDLGIAGGEARLYAAELNAVTRLELTPANSPSSRTATPPSFAVGTRITYLPNFRSWMSAR